MNEQGLGRIIRLANAPGAVLVRVAGMAVVPFLVLAILAVRNQPAVFAWILLALAVFLSAGVAFFAWRRARLAALVDEAEVHAARDLEPVEVHVADQLGQLQEFDAERRLRRDTWLPRVEATQRALVRAAGGVERAPFLKDDLRVTLIALLVTLAAVPAGTLGTFLALLHLIG
nr:hypothetical protein [Actinomycetales bacterium]